MSGAGVLGNLNGDDVNADQPWSIDCGDQRNTAVVQTNDHRGNDSLVGNAGSAGRDRRRRLTKTGDVELNIFTSLRRIGGAYVSSHRAELRRHKFCHCRPT